MASFNAPRTNDYGGNRYGRRPYSAKRSNSLSFRCRDCLTIRYVTQRELNRAARPKCLRCGGTLIETEATADKTLSEESVNNLKKLKEEQSHPRGIVRCCACNLAWKKNYFLGRHLQDSIPCQKHYQEKGFFVSLAGKTVFKGTFSLIRGEATKKEKWAVLALSKKGQFIVVQYFPCIEDAQDFFRDHVVSLSAARHTVDWKESPSYRECNKVNSQNHVRCPGCNAKFVTTSQRSFKANLVLHLALNDDCFEFCKDDELKEDAREIRDNC